MMELQVLVIKPDIPDCKGGGTSLSQEVTAGRAINKFAGCYEVTYATHPADTAALTVELLLVLVVKQFAFETEILKR